MERFAKNMLWLCVVIAALAVAACFVALAASGANSVYREIQWTINHDR